MSNFCISTLLSVFLITSFLNTLSLQAAVPERGRSKYYYDDSSLVSLAKNGKLIFFSTGLSGSAMGKMWKPTNDAKQARGFGIAYSLALRMYRLGIKGKVFYFTTDNVDDVLRKYLFDLHYSEAVATDAQVPALDTDASRMQAFAEFEKNYFEQVVLDTKAMERDLPARDSGRYEWAWEGRNAKKLRTLRGQVDDLKKQGAFFYGFEYHFGGPFFQRLLDALQLPGMRLLGSEINDQLSDEFFGRFQKLDQSWIHANASKYDQSGPSKFPLNSTKMSEIPADLGTKSQCRRTFQAVGVRHPRGSYWPQRSLSSLSKDLYRFLQTHREVTRVMLKLERSSAGDGNIKYDFGKIIKDHPDFWTNKHLAYGLIKGELEVKIFDEEHKKAEYAARLQEYGAIYEELVEGKDFKSPAVLGMIMPDGVEVYYDYNQILGGPDNQTYMGSIGPASLPLGGKPQSGVLPEADLTTPSTKILEYLRMIGARGAVGIDFVTTEIVNAQGEKERIAYAIENNVRHTGTMYPNRVLFFLVGQEMLGSSHFASINSVPVPELDAKQRAVVRKWFYHEFLKQDENSYNSLRGTGCIVYMDTWVKGEIGIACLGETHDKTKRMFEEFKETIPRAVQAYVKSL